MFQIGTKREKRPLDDKYTEIGNIKMNQCNLS